MDKEIPVHLQTRNFVNFQEFPEFTCKIIEVALGVWSRKLHGILQHYATLHDITRHYMTLHDITRQFATWAAEVAIWTRNPQSICEGGKLRNSMIFCKFSCSREIIDFLQITFSWYFLRRYFLSFAMIMVFLMCNEIHNAIFSGWYISDW